MRTFNHVLAAFVIGFLTFSNYQFRVINGELSRHQASCPFSEKFLKTSWAQGKVTYEFWYCDGVAVKARSTQPHPTMPGREVVLELNKKDVEAAEKIVEEFKGSRGDK
jgi:hypothetical protein